MRGLYNYGTRRREPENFVSDSSNLSEFKCSNRARVLMK
jgi:hypothetical protein